MRAFEFKWSGRVKVASPRLFAQTYPDATFEVITPDNFWVFVRQQDGKMPIEMARSLD